LKNQGLVTCGQQESVPVREIPKVGLEPTP
jgi:hypothetical protein